MYAWLPILAHVYWWCNAIYLNSFFSVAAFFSIILSVSIVDDEERKTGWVEGFAILMAVFIVVIVTAVNDYTKERQFRDLQKKLESSSR